MPIAGCFAVIGVLARRGPGGLASSPPEAPRRKFDQAQPDHRHQAAVLGQSLWQLLKQMLKLGVIVLIAYKTSSA